MLKVDVPEDLIRGDVDEGYGAVADAFRRNFSEKGEIGAACAIYRNGRKVVDLWGGYRDGIERLPWEEHTLVTVFSATKGMSSIPVAVAHSWGLLDLEASVATYWPEFGQNGKERITVRQLLSHQAGLAVVDQPFDLETVGDLDRLGDILAAQKPGWESGTRHGYHAMTLGFYESELLRRVDPQRRSIGRFFAEEVAAPLGIEFYIGLPQDLESVRLATLHMFRPPEMLLNINKMPWRMVVSFLNPRGVLSRSMRTVPILMKQDAMNQRDVLAVEMPSVNGTGEVRGMARAYGSLATGGKELGLGVETVKALEEEAIEPSGGRRDLVVQADTAFSLGYLKPCPALRFGTSSRAFGTPGGGGSFGFADPDAGVGYAYAMNRLGFYFPVDPREVELRDAFYKAIDGPPQRAD